MDARILPLCLLSLVASAQNVQKIVEGNNTFTFKLYKEVKSFPDKNLFFSPFSISTALAMTYAGAKKETSLQIRRTMNFPQGKTFHTDYKHLLEMLKEGTGDKIKLNFADGLWAQKGYRFLDSYFILVKMNYKSEIKNVDFNDDSEREKARRGINLWVEQKTNDKIKDLLTPNDLTSMTRLVLVNAIYFYGEWAKPFEIESTIPDNFFLLDKTRIKVEFMNQCGSYNYFEDPDIKVLEIPYKDSKASLVILLPNKKDGILELEKSIDYKYYLDVIGLFRTENVQLSLPKFKTTFKINLGNTLSQMGMPLAFSPKNADFSGMTGKRDLCISEVIHQAFIAVDEKGTEAAAATAVIMKMMAMRPSNDIKVFNADHPFIFLIKDNATGCILFMGKMMNPKASE